MLTQCASNPRVQPNELKVAAHQFQPAVGSELFVTELDRKLSLDRPPQPPYLQPHLCGLSCRLELRCCRTPNDAPEAPFLRSNRRIDQNYFRFRAICHTDGSKSYQIRPHKPLEGKPKYLVSRGQKNRLHVSPKLVTT